VIASIFGVEAPVIGVDALACIGELSGEEAREAPEALTGIPRPGAAVPLPGIAMPLPCIANAQGAFYGERLL